MEDHIGTEYEEYITNKSNRDGGSNHITVINVSDYNRLTKVMGMDKFTNSLEGVLKFPIDDLKLMGLGTASRNNNTSYFVVCKSNKLDSIRNRYKLNEHDFHITLGFCHRDVFGVRKNTVMEEKSQFLDIFSKEFLKKENFNFIRTINNFNGDSEAEIIPLSINDKYLKIIVGKTIMDIGLIESDLRVLTSYDSDKEANRMPLTEIIGFLKNNIKK